MKNKIVYAIMYGFYSSFENAEYDSFYSTKELALKVLIKTIKDRDLKLDKRGKNVYTDGDYYTCIQEIQLDTELI